MSNVRRGLATEQTLEVLNGRFADGLQRLAAQDRDLLRDFHDERGLVALAAVRRRREERRVRLDEKAVARNGARDLLDHLGAREREDAGERDVEAERERAARQLFPAREAVDHAAALARLLFFEQRRRLVVGLARV